MLYQIFKVRTNKPKSVPDYYIVNNMYVGYVGLDCSSKTTIRSILEYHAKVNIKLKFQLIAVKNFPQDNEELHRMFCDGIRLDDVGMEQLIEEWGFVKLKDETWWKEYYPIRNCSYCILQSEDKTKIMMDNFTIVPIQEFKINRKLYIPHYLL